MQYISGPVELQGFHDKDGGSDNHSPPDSQEAVCKKAKWLSGEALQIALKRREVKSKGEPQMVKNLPAVQETQVRSLGQEDSC